jgi:DeoR family fructose operon transcriptional repressor
MLPTERHLKIIEEINDGGLVSADSLAALFDVSLETVRRDLRELERQGLLQRVYGGAIGPEVRTDEIAFEHRRLQNKHRKRMIAEQAAALVEPGDTIFIDSGSTCLEFARSLSSDWSGRVLTNCLLVAVELAARPQLEVLITGGQVRSGDLSCSGDFGVALHDNFYVARAFVGAGGVHPDAGLTDYQIAEGSSRRLWIERSAAFYVMADSSKLGVIAPFRVAPIEAITAVVTDDEERGEVLEHLISNGTEVIVGRSTSVAPITSLPQRRVRHSSKVQTGSK